MTAIRPSRPGHKLRNIRVPEDLWTEAKRTAANNDTTISEVIRQYLAEWVAR